MNAKKYGPSKENPTLEFVVLMVEEENQGFVNEEEEGQCLATMVEALP